MKKLPRAKYECLKCGHKFTLPEPEDLGTDCKKCEHPYVLWKNAELWIRRVDWQLENDDAG